MKSDMLQDIRLSFCCWEGKRRRYNVTSFHSSLFFSNILSLSVYIFVINEIWRFEQWIYLHHAMIPRMNEATVSIGYHAWKNCPTLLLLLCSPIDISQPITCKSLPSHSHHLHPLSLSITFQHPTVYTHALFCSLSLSLFPFFHNQFYPSALLLLGEIFVSWSNVVFIVSIRPKNYSIDSSFLILDWK